ncbi:hypothetical protein C9374_001513 [Naegleria lovaniensis]|uniref:Uncharacterized protein n=1 Tax=Naegleria lovaniensis TaxID=51637 RepID=A0AA88GRQ5_NAELO|nr:uncharacterized protein C9374_001513 [Naegleria lovaniensis]KAG2387181.1 hypothetical protein C9374_001513 [Naegleria lovaniensis]
MSESIHASLLTIHEEEETLQPISSSLPTQQHNDHHQQHHEEEKQQDKSDARNDDDNLKIFSQQIYDYISQKNFRQALEVLIHWMNSDHATPDDGVHMIEFLKKIYKLGFQRLSNVFRELEQGQNDCKKLILAAMYCGRCGHEVDYEKAMALFESDSLKYHYFSQNMLGNIYSNGPNGIDVDYHLAKEYYEMAAAQNYSSGFHNLGNLYYYGNGVEQNYTKAKEYFELAAQKNHHDFKCNKYLAFENHYSEALYVLGTLYEWGDGVVLDTKKAMEYYKQAVELNNEYSAFSIGETLENSNDFEGAVKYYTISANLNYAEAQYRLAEMYQTGLGVAQNLSKAIYYFELAAEQEYYDAEEQGAALRLQRFYLNFHSKLFKTLALGLFSDVIVVAVQEYDD